MSKPVEETERPAEMPPSVLHPGQSLGASESADVALTRILLVDDDPENLRLLQRHLRRRYRLFTASDGAAAIAILKEVDVQIILSDYRMPGQSGVDVLAAAFDLRPDAMRILVTAFGDMDIATDAINRGHIDFLIRKPWSEDELRSTLARAEEIQRLKAENARLIDHLRMKTLILEEKERLLEKSLDDRGRELLETVRELERTNQRLSELVLRDGLTGLFNHRCLQSRLREECDRARRYNHALGLVFIDVDHFKIYNDLHGHPSGDQLLCLLAKALAPGPGAAGRSSDFVARYGGDEFVVLLPETDRSGTLTYVNRIRESVAQALFPGQEQLPSRKVTLSIGLANFPEDGASAGSLLAAADRALYRAKQRGRDRVEVASDDGPVSEPTLPVDTRPPVVSYRERLEELEAILRVDGCLSLLLVNIGRLRPIEQYFGRSTYEDLRLGFEEVLARWVSQEVRSAILAHSTFGNDTFLVFYGREGAESDGALQRQAESLEQTIGRELSERLWQLTGESMFPAVGHARIVQHPGLAAVRQIETLMQDAIKVEDIRYYQQLLHTKDRIQKVILGGEITTLYQPIVHVATREVTGFEALTRGPSGSEMHAPDRLFHTTERVGLHHQLDRLCIRHAIAGAEGFGSGYMLFVNTLPSTLHDATFIAAEITQSLEKAHISPAQLVLEVSEKEAVRNPGLFQSAIERCHIAGVRVAIDDVGSRFSNFDVLLSGSPDYLKISDILIRGIDRSIVKQSMVRGLLSIALDIGAAVITEGIETAEELKVLAQLGVQFCQGWYFSKAEPAPWRKARS